MKRRERIQRIIIFILLIGLLVTQSPFDISAAVKCKSIALNVTKATIGVGDILPLTAITKPLNATGNQKWTSSDKKVATVNKYGAVTGVGEGTAKITVKIGKKKATCVVTVVKAEVGTNIKQELVNYPTKSEVYTKEEVDKIVAEKVKEATKSVDLSGYAAKKDVYTKAEVDKLIEDKVKEIEASSSGKTEEKDWEDGTELELRSSVALPLKKTYPTSINNGYIQINSISIKKYHRKVTNYTDPSIVYKVSADINMIYPDITGRDDCNYLQIRLYNENKHGYSSYEIGIFDTTKTDDNGNCVINETITNISSDYDSFDISIDQFEDY